MISFVITGEPRGKGRPRARTVRTKSGSSFVSIYTDAETRKYEEFIAKCAGAVMTGKKPLTIPLSIDLEINSPIPASWSKKKQQQASLGLILPTTKPDIDNIGKAVLDGMNGVVYEDDKLIVDIASKKRYSLTPCIKVTIREAMPCLGIDAL